MDLCKADFMARSYLYESSPHEPSLHQLPILSSVPAQVVPPLLQSIRRRMIYDSTESAIEGKSSGLDSAPNFNTETNPLNTGAIWRPKSYLQAKHTDWARVLNFSFRIPYKHLFVTDP